MNTDRIKQTTASPVSVIELRTMIQVWDEREQQHLYLRSEEVQALYNLAKKMVWSHRPTFREVDIPKEDTETILRIFGISAVHG